MKIDLTALTAGRTSPEFQALSPEAQRVGIIAMDAGVTATELVDSVVAFLKTLKDGVG